MAASYPGATKSFSTKTPGQTVASAHIDDLQDEVVAVENGLRTGLAHNLLPDGDVTRSLGTSAARFLHPAGTAAAPGVAVSETDIGLYSSGTNALDFSTNGTKALGIDSTQFIDSPTQPRASVTNSATQSLTDSTLTAIAFDTEVFDVGTTHDNVTNNTRLTVPAGGDGIYLIVGQVGYTANATGLRMARIRKNGSAALNTTLVTTTAADTPSIPVSAIASLAAADYVELIGYQSSTGALNVTAAGCSLMFVKLW